VILLWLPAAIVWGMALYAIGDAIATSAPRPQITTLLYTR
jgi:hypothetical protein